MARRPQFIGFPEFSLTGWITDPKQALPPGAAPLRRIGEWARRHGVFIATGFVERRGPRLHNACIIAGPKGVVGVMRKVNLISREYEDFTPGREFPVFEVAGCRMGVATCADASRFEMFHILSMRGAEVVFAPHANSLGAYGNCRSGWVRWRTGRWPWYAEDCKVAIAGMSCAGLSARPPLDEQPLKYCGGGLIVDWTGKRLAALGGKSRREGMLVADIDLAALREARGKARREFNATATYNRKGWVWGAR